ncbi:hypothetical protein BV25DRAFT_1827284 [Artomyces pyxidatus]|uniref:Uncharacterized protein n=1 Tax=Artomyces pyxidatus TaxID=48021 RepID=A0ACB8SX61_9AGAM|nr:hypothetical protein BV25DRAFT_1827284 [Artomyces pyxidatus]
MATKKKRMMREVWPASKLPKDKTITATDARKSYRLDTKDLDGLHYDKIPSRRDETRIMHLYKEQIIEHAAWEKHGGPVGWNRRLDVLRRRYKRAHPDGEFPEPEQVHHYASKLCKGCLCRIWEGTTAYENDVPVCQRCDKSSGSRDDAQGRGTNEMRGSADRSTAGIHDETTGAL